MFYITREYNSACHWHINCFQVIKSKSVFSIGYGSQDYNDEKHFAALNLAYFPESVLFIDCYHIFSINSVSRGKIYNYKGIKMIFEHYSNEHA